MLEKDTFTTQDRERAADIARAATEHAHNRAATIWPTLASVDYVVETFFGGGVAYAVEMRYRGSRTGILLTRTEAASHF